MYRRTLLKWMGFSAVTAVLAGCGVADSTDASTDSTKDTSMPATTQPAIVSVMVFDRAGKLVGPVTEPRILKTDAEWKAQLTPAEYKVCRAKGTEPAFCGTLLDNHEDGVYSCTCCGLPLFQSNSKFNSGTGWPSFFQPIAKQNVIEHEDDGWGMVRTEILCARCDCHLGHVFDDGPKPTGLRFCVNSESLKFTPIADVATLADPAAPA